MIRKQFLVPEISTIYIVGTGGTGGFFAQGLAKMIAGYQLKTEVLLIDPDIIEEKNCIRQNFDFSEIGEHKAEALAVRLNARFGTQFGFRVGLSKDVKVSFSKLVVSCTDNIASRKVMKGEGMWLDIGNGLETGQAVFGTTCNKPLLKLEKDKWSERPAVHQLPSPFIVGNMAKAKDKKNVPSCADQPFDEQGPFVNEQAALVGLTIMNQILIKQAVTTPHIYFNIATGRMTPAFITKDLYG